MKLYLDVNPSDPDSAPGKGEIPATHVIVGIAPSPSRPFSRRNEPFGSKSYGVIEKIRQHLPSLYVTNFKKSPQPFKQKIYKREIPFWAELLYEELGCVCIPGKTRILTLGVDPALLLCPGFKKLREDHGTVFYNPQLDVEVIPTYHFAAMMRNPSMKPLIARDLERFTTEIFEDHPEVIEALPTTNLGSKIFLDIETTGIEIPNCDITKVAFSGDDDTVYILSEPTEELYNLVKDSTLVGHNFQFDLAFMEYKSGIPWTNVKVEDTMLMAHVVGEHILSLKHLTTAYTNRKGSRSGGGFEDNLYAAEDVISTREVYEVFKKRAGQQWITKLLNEMSPQIARMRLYGVFVEWDLVSELASEGLQKSKEANDLLRIQLGKFRIDPEINWNSNTQVADALLKAGVPLSEKTETGKYSVSEPVLSKFREEHPLIDSYFAYKDALHDLGFLTSYLELKWPDDLLHPKFNLVGPATGRSSMSDPNLQQVPRVGPIKTIFTSRFVHGLFGLVDLDQAELRIAALLSGDWKFMEAILSTDVHRVLASTYLDKPPEDVTARERKASKAITFGLLYGGSVGGLSQRSGLRKAAVEKGLRLFFSRFPVLEAYIQEQRSLAVKTGYSVTPFGRIRDLRLLIETEGDRSAARKGINNPIQSAANDCMFTIMNYVMRETHNLGLESGVIFGVHDSSAHDIAPDEVETYSKIVQEGFLVLNETPLAELELWGELPLTGELVLGESWASVESTNEQFYNPLQKIPCSTLGETS